MSISKPPVDVVIIVGAAFGALEGSGLMLSIESRLSCSFLVSSLSMVESLLLFWMLSWLRDVAWEFDKKFCFLNGACLKIFELPLNVIL